MAKKYSDELLSGSAPQPDSILRKAGRGLVSGISAAANVLDLPGSSVRDVLSGRNPLDQYLHPFTQEGRTSGRDLLRSHGLAGRKDSWANFGGGLAADIALDPLTYLTLGGSALGKVGKVAKMAGVHGDEAARIFSKAMGKAPGAYGKRQARLGLTPSMIQQHAPEAFGRMQGVAGRMKQPLDLTKSMDEPLGALAEFWPTGTLLGKGKAPKTTVSNLQVPTGTATKTVSTPGNLPWKIAGAMDTVGDTIRHVKIPGTDIQPVASVFNLFNKRALGATSRGMMQAAGHITDRKEVSRVAAREQGAKAVHMLQSRGYADDQKLREVSKWFEYPDTAPQELRPLVDEYHQQWAVNRQRADELGAPWLGNIEEKQHFSRQRPQISHAAQLKKLSETDLQKHIQDLSDYVANSNPTKDRFFNSIMVREQLAKGELAARKGPNYRQLNSIELLQSEMSGTKHSRKYAPLRGTEGILPNKGRASAPLSARTPTAEVREPATLGAAEGANTIRDVAEYAEQLKRQAFTPYKPDQLGKELRRKFKGEVPDRYLTGKQFSALKQHIADTPALGLLGAEPTVSTARSLVKQGVKKIGEVGLEPKRTWKRLGQWMDAMSPELLKSGIYGNYPITDFMAHGISQGQSLQAAELLNHYLIDNWKSQGLFHATGEAIGGVLKSMGMRLGDHTQGAAKYVMDRIGMPIPAYPKEAAKAIKSFAQLKLSPEHVKFIKNAYQGWDTPESVEGILKLYDSWNNLAKFAFTSADPRFHGRNLPSGQFNSLMDASSSAKAIKAGMDVARTGLIEGAAKHPLAVEEAAKRGVANLDDKLATQFLQEKAFAHETTGHAGTGITAPQHVGGSVKDILHEMPGEVPFSVGGLGQTLKGSPGAWNPLSQEFRTIRGVGGATETLNPWGKAGEQVGNLVEHMNRFPSWYELTRQGMDPAEAAKRVGEAQARYQNRFYTKTEQQVMNRLVLFYKFFRSQMPFTLQMLVEHPGGRLAQVLRSINRSRDEDELVPDWIKETASIPVPGQTEDGTKRYLTGLGLPFEDPIQFASPSLQNMMLEGASRLNPIIKAPAEYMTGQSFFQKGGPHGGRPLDELDPALGRTLSNIGELTGLRTSKAPIRYHGSGLIEHMLSNSPLSPLLTKARTLTDPRKGPWAKASNLLSGLKITDVSPASQDRELRNSVQRIEKALGAKTFVQTYLPKDTKAGLSPVEQQQAAQLAALKRLLDERSKYRKK